MKLNIDKEWLLQMAEKEGNNIISVGGLISKIKELEEKEKKIWWKQVEEAKLKDKLFQIRVDEAINELEQLADLLADSEELPVKQTNAVQRINEIIKKLSQTKKEK